MLSSVLREAILAFNLLSSPGAAAQLLQPVAVFGNTDDRSDLFEVTDSNIWANASGVAGIFSREPIKNSDGSFSIRSDPQRAHRWTDRQSQQPFGLCSNERFIDQQYEPYCTAFLVKPDVVVTAGHCVNDAIEDPRRLWVIFGFRMRDSKALMDRVSAADIYRIKRVILSRPEHVSTDWAVMILDRRVQNRTPVAMPTTAARLKIGDSIYTIGYPLGLPLKVTRNGVITADNGDHLRTDLDAFIGNSGGPVFNSSTHDLVGMVSSGIDDFELSSETVAGQPQQCWRSQCTRDCALGNGVLELKSIPIDDAEALARR